MSYTRGKNPNSRNGFKKGHTINVGSKRSQESRTLMSVVQKQQVRDGKTVPIRKGSKWSYESRRRHRSWKGGVTPTMRLIRN